MIIVKGNAGFCDANQIVSAFVKATAFQSKPPVYSVQVDLQGLTLPHGFTLARYYSKAEAQDALNRLAFFLGYEIGSITPDKIFDLNRVENKEDE